MNWTCRVLFLLPAVASLAGAAQPIVIDLDPAKTRIEYTLGDVLHTVHGTFRLKSGTVDVDPARKLISGNIVVDAASGDSGSNARDSRMKKNILEVDRYPEIVFAPAAVEGDPSQTSTVTVKGWFTIHGQRHEISLPLQVKVSGADGVATGKFTVPYVAWGMKNPSTFVLRVNQEVDVQVTAVGHLRAGPTPPAI